MLRKIYGDTVVPDFFAILIPDEAFFRKVGIRPDVSVLVGKGIFGARSQQVDDDGPFFGPPHFPGNPHFPTTPGFPKFKQRFYLKAPEIEEDDPAKRGKQKKFYSILEFCFYDHRTRKAFGYGWDVVESDYRGEITEALFGRKVNLYAHMGKMADNLVGLFFQEKKTLLKHYREAELVIENKPALPPEKTLEVLEEDEEE